VEGCLIATEVLEIRVTGSGARVVQQDLESLGKAGDKATASIDFLKYALEALAVGETLRQFVSLSDAFTEMSNKLRVVSESQEAANAQMGVLADVAAATRTPLDATVESLHRLTEATEQLGLDSRTTTALVAEINEVMKVGGADAGAAAPAVTGFTAALANNFQGGRAIQGLLR
jgi:hypothetical protein